MKAKHILLYLTVASSGLISCHKGSSTTTTGNWVYQGEMTGVVRSEAVTFVINDTGYIATGYDGTYRLNDLWQYDAVNNNWTQKDTFPGTPRSSAVAFTAAGKGYVATGFDGVNMLKDVWAYDPATDSWSQKTDFGGSARYDAVAFGIQDKGYLSTGFDGNYLKDTWQYDPTTDTWTTIPTFGGSKRLGAVAFVYNNKGYIVTGVNNGSTVNDFWSFDPSTTKWTQLRPITNVSTDSYDDNYTDIIRSNAAAFIIGDKAYISTGQTATGSLLSSTWEYDFSTDLWTSKTAFEKAARTGAVSFSLPQGGFILTGRSSTYAFDDINQFFPDQAYNAND
ncbi:MAG TPA: kelch repeat-containing protein [Chitinophagaceae bacterium]|nr:kelch repeat-containing protein [Chitinophagaceae bacterium]